MFRLIWILVSALALSACVSSQNVKWSRVQGPTINLSQIYGGYSAGCLDGGISLAASSDKYQVMRVARKRYYGHPQLIQFLENYAEHVFASELGVLAIGDLSQARGGPMPHGHASHQVGLDADIWFKRFSVEEQKHLDLNDLENMPAVSMLSDNGQDINMGEWNEGNAVALKIAAMNNEVERIFVNYVIKKELCKTHKGEKWLSKIRPWWGHEYHYHIRLSCPANNPDCVPQSEIDSTDGCDDTLDWWFSEDAKNELNRRISSKTKEKILPIQCKNVFHNDGHP